MELKKAFDSKKQIYAWACFYAITLIAVVFMSRSGVGQITTALTMLAVCVSVFLSLENTFLFIVAVIPWGQVFKIPNGYTAATLLMLVFIIKNVILSNRVMFHIKKTTFRIYASYFACLGISIIAAVSNNSNIVEVISFFMDFLFVIVSVQILSDRSNLFERSAGFFVVSALLVCFCSTLFPALSRSFGKISEYSKANPGFSSLWDFGRLTLVSIAFIVVDYLNHHDHLIWKAIFTIILVNYLIQCGRFSILLGLASLLVCLPFITKHKDVSIKKRIIYFIGMLLLFLILLFVLYYFFYQDMVALRGVEASDNGRFEVWKTYLDYLGKKPAILLFGIGGGAISTLGSSLNTATAHNILLEKIVELGVVGIALVVYILVRLYKSKKDNIIHNLYLMPLIAFLGTSLTQGTTGSLTFALLIILCMCKDSTDDSDKYIEGEGSNLQEPNEYEDTSSTK